MGIVGPDGKPIDSEENEYKLGSFGFKTKATPEDAYRKAHADAQKDLAAQGLPVTQAHPFAFEPGAHALFMDMAVEFGKLRDRITELEAKLEEQTIVSTLMGNVASQLPELVGAAVEKAGVSPVHTTNNTNTTQIVNKAVPGPKGAPGKNGRDGKNAKLSAAQLDRIQRAAIAKATKAIVREVQSDPNKYRGPAGKDGGVYVEVGPELPPKPPGILD